MEDQNEIESKTSANLLYPELMSQDELIAVLKQRYIQNEDLPSLSKEGLVELYYSYVLPLPQRKYRLNRRGKEMTKKQIVMAKKRKISSTDGSEPPKKKSSADSSSRLLSSFNITSHGERLKPPPSCIDYSKKKISLSSKNKTEINIASQLENTNLNSDSRENDDTQTLRKKIVKITLNSSSTDSPKRIRLNSSSSSLSCDQNNSSDSSKRVKLNSPTSPGKEASFKSTVGLINKHLGETTDTCSKERPKNINASKPIYTPEGSTKKKAKIARISWP